MIVGNAHQTESTTSGAITPETEISSSANLARRDSRLLVKLCQTSRLTCTLVLRHYPSLYTQQWDITLTSRIASGKPYIRRLYRAIATAFEDNDLLHWGMASRTLWNGQQGLMN